MYFWAKRAFFRFQITSGGKTLIISIIAGWCRLGLATIVAHKLRFELKQPILQSDKETVYFVPSKTIWVIRFDTGQGGFKLQIEESLQFE